MTIDVPQIDSFATVQIGNPPDSPLYEDDTLKRIYVLAEGFDTSGTPINPAPFASDSGGWGAEIEMDTASNLVPTVDTPLADDGQVVVRLALHESLGKAGKHRGNVRIYNPVVGRTQQRVLFNLVLVITSKDSQ